MTRSRNILARRVPFGPEEDAVIRALFPVNATREVAARLDRTESAVSQRANRIGVGKCPEYLATKAFRFNGSEPQSVASRFKPGQAPPNKGLRRPGYAPGRMAETQFHKGRAASDARNYQPIGAERITRDGILERKVSDDLSMYPAKRWLPVTRIVWEAAYGPIPQGYSIVFKPGRKSTDAACINTDALELVSRAELMRRNSYHTRYPKEVALLIQLKGALNRKINRRQKS